MRGGCVSLCLTLILCVRVLAPVFVRVRVVVLGACDHACACEHAYDCVFVCDRGFDVVCDVM